MIGEVLEKVTLSQGYRHQHEGETATRGEGDGVFSSEKCCLFLCSFIFSDLSFMAFKEVTLLSFTRFSGGFFEVTTFLSHHTPPDKFLIRSRPHPMHLLMFL